MSDETPYDPWDASANEEPPADVQDSADEFDEFDDILADMEEEESGEAVRVREDFAKKYDNPLDVGLVDGMWVPVRILTAEVKDKHVPRLSSEVCTAKDANGKRYVLFDAVEKALKDGATETVGKVPLPYFVCLANHAAPAYGERRYDWEIEVPVFTIKTALFKPQRNRTGYMNEHGRSLRLATGATAKGETVTAKDPAPEGQTNMHEVAARMDDQIVMAQVSIVTNKKTKFRPVLDENKNKILVRADANSGDPVIIFRLDDGSGYVVDGTGEVWTGEEKDLVAVDDTRFAILDNSDTATPLMEEYHPINDYINPPFLPLPERKVTVELVKTGPNGEPLQGEGEITLDTVGAIARGVGSNSQVDVLLRSGETVTAMWFGTQWVEKPVPVDGEENGMAQFTGNEALASL